MLEYVHGRQFHGQSLHFSEETRGHIFPERPVHLFSARIDCRGTCSDPENQRELSLMFSCSDPLLILTCFCGSIPG